MPDGTTFPDGDAKSGEHKLFPLLLAQEGESVRLVSCRSGKGLGRRLRDLGIPLGVEVRIVQRRANGVVLGRGAARIALGHSAAQKISVELLAEPTS